MGSYLGGGVSPYVFHQSVTNGYPAVEVIREMFVPGQGDSPAPSLNSPPVADSNVEFLDAVVTVVNEAGLHLRVAMRIVELCRTLPDEIEWISEEARANGKSMLELLGLAAAPGTSLRVVARGPSAEDSLRKVLASLSPEEIRIDRGAVPPAA